MADLSEDFDFSSEDETEWNYDEKGSPVQCLSDCNSKEDDKPEISTAENSKKNISRMEINTSKAGMDGLDREKINQIIFEASKGSRFYENEKKREKQVQKKIEELQHKMSLLTFEEKVKARQEVDKIVEELENTRDLSRTIVHIDMDAFYAAVEMRDDESLRSKPMAVGGSAMLCTSNYSARRYGVRAGMPGFIGKKLCPQLVIVPGNYKKYTKISEEIREVMALYDPNYLPMSLDEAYLDITDYLEKIGKDKMVQKSIKREMFERDDNFKTSPQEGTCELTSAQGRVRDEKVASKNTNQEISKDFCNDVKCQNVGAVKEETEDKMKGPNFEKIAQSWSCDEVEAIVKEIRSKIEERTQLTASAGIAPNMFLAKVCSDMNKPNGQYYLKPDKQSVMDFVRQLPVRKAFGIGRVSEQILTSVLNINTCNNLYEKRHLIYLLFTLTACRSYLEIALGLGSTVVEVNRERKSMSTETTFREINKPEQLLSKCYELCCELSKSMKQEGLMARKIGVKLKNVNFEVKTKISSSTTAIQEADEIFSHAKKLVNNEIKACIPQPLRLRLMGVRAAELCHRKDVVQESKQLTITGLLKQTGNISGSSNSLSGSKLAKTEDGLTHGEWNNSLFPEEDLFPNTSKQLECTMGISENCNEKLRVTNMEKETSFTCPVCGKQLSFKCGSALLQFNQHVDTCLNTQTITNLLREDFEKNSDTNKDQNSKKRKRDSPIGKGKRKTIDHFLKK